MADILNQQVAPLDSRTERARQAVKVFRSMQPQLTAYARTITKKRDVEVMLAETGIASAYTDGKKIYFIPPIALGDGQRHVRSRCDKRDHTGTQLCPACAVREGVLAVVYHEIAHICYDSFAPVTEYDKARITANAVQEGGTSFAKALQERYDRAPLYVKNSYKGLASLFNEFLPLIANALEDARVNAEMFRARKGTKQMFEARSRKTFTDGVEQKNALGEVVRVKWSEYPRNLQAIIGCYCRLSGYNYEGWFHPEVEADLGDPDLVQVLNLMSTVRDPSGVYNLSFKVLEQLRRLGYCKAENDPEPEEEPEDESQPKEDQTPEQGDGDEGDDSDDTGDKAEPGSDELDGSEEPEGESDDGADSDGAGSSAGSGDGAGSEPSDSDDVPPDEDSAPADGSDVQPSSGTEGGSGEPGAGEPEGDVDAGGENDRGADGSDDLGEAGTPPSEAEGGGTGSDGDEADDGGGQDDSSLHSSAGSDSEPGEGDSETGSSDGADSSEEALDDDGEQASDQSDEGSGDPSSEPSSGDSGLGSGGLTDGPEDAAGPEDDGLPGGEQVGDDGEQLDAGGQSELDSDSEASPIEPTLGGGFGPPGPHDDGPAQDDQRSPDDATGPAQDPSPDDVEPPDTGADQGLGGIEVDEQPDYGTADDIANEVAEWLGHGERSQSEKVERAKDEEALRTAIVQGTYFETPSNNVRGVKEIRFDSLPENFDGAWRTYADPSLRRYLGIDADVDVPESALGAALLRMRVAFSDNKRGHHQRNLKSGKIDARVLGKRVHNDDPRLFKRSIQPGKKDYFVAIALDVSGSTVGENIILMRRAVMAQATLLNRMGISFAIFAHSGSNSADSTGDWDMDVYWIKEPHEPWSDKVQHRLRELGPDSMNLDGHAMEFLRKILDKQVATDKVALYYSDGKMPAANYQEELEILQREIRVCKMSGYTLLGVGIRTDSPARHGLDTVQVHTDEDIVKVVRHIEKRLSQGR